jgi:hypothetical protein
VCVCVCVCIHLGANNVDYNYNVSSYIKCILIIYSIYIINIYGR